MVRGFSRALATLGARISVFVGVLEGGLNLCFGSRVDMKRNELNGRLSGYFLIMLSVSLKGSRAKKNFQLERGHRHVVLSRQFGLSLILSALSASITGIEQAGSSAPNRIPNAGLGGI